MLIARDAQQLFCRRRHQPSRPPLAKIKPGSQHRRWGERDCRPKKFGGVQETKQVNTRFRAVVSQEDERNRRHSGSSSQRPLGQSSRVAFRLTGTSSRQVGFTSPHPGWLNAGALSLKGNEAKPSVSTEFSRPECIFWNAALRVNEYTPYGGRSQTSGSSTGGSDLGSGSGALTACKAASHRRSGSRSPAFASAIML